ncbi:MAG: DUF751 family protein [Synechococcales bacterium]|nr:DUF751 family protein [Synechococcales bacterium]
MQDFWENISRYPRYFVTIILGVLLNSARPFIPLLQRPVTAIPLIGLVLAGFAFLVFTLRAMLGLNIG